MGRFCEQNTPLPPENANSVSKSAVSVQGTANSGVSITQSLERLAAREGLGDFSQQATRQ